MDDDVDALALERVGDAARRRGLSEIDAIVARLGDRPRRRNEIEEHETAARVVGFETFGDATTENAERAGERDSCPAHHFEVLPRAEFDNPGGEITTRGCEATRRFARDLRRAARALRN